MASRGPERPKANMALFLRGPGMSQARTFGRPRPRIETLSDLIFGLSLSIGAIGLIGSAPVSAGEINSHLAAFIFTFLILITSWLTYTAQMSVLPVETRLVAFLNVVMLLLVAMVPYLLNNVALVNPGLSSSEASAIRDYASVLFGLDLAGILAILGVFAHVLTIEEKGLVAPEYVTRFRNSRNRIFILSAILLVSLAPQFWTLTLLDVPLRLYVWYIPIIVYWVVRLRRDF